MSRTAAVHLLYQATKIYKLYDTVGKHVAMSTVQSNQIRQQPTHAAIRQFQTTKCSLISLKLRCPMSIFGNNDRHYRDNPCRPKRASIGGFSDPAVMNYPEQRKSQRFALANFLLGLQTETSGGAIHFVEYDTNECGRLRPTRPTTPFGVRYMHTRRSLGYQHCLFCFCTNQLADIPPKSTMAGQERYTLPGFVWTIFHRDTGPQSWARPRTNFCWLRR
jgi:hypothetical protein